MSSLATLHELRDVRAVLRDARESEELRQVPALQRVEARLLRELGADVGALVAHIFATDWTRWGKAPRTHSSVRHIMASLAPPHVGP